jgi:hypothetical protein
MPMSIAHARRAGPVPHPFLLACGGVDRTGASVGPDEALAGVPCPAGGLDEDELVAT